VTDASRTVTGQGHRYSRHQCAIRQAGKPLLRPGESCDRAGTPNGQPVAGHGRHRAVEPSHRDDAGRYPHPALGYLIKRLITLRFFQLWREIQRRDKNSPWPRQAGPVRRSGCGSPCHIGHHAGAEMGLGALLAAAEWHADSGADVFGHPLKRPIRGDFEVCTSAPKSHGGAGYSPHGLHNHRLYAANAA
jgi:hypothetical protein